MTVSAVPTSASRRQQRDRAGDATLDARWKPLAIVAGAAALGQVALILIQIPIYLLSPPPSTVEGFFALLQRNPILGLLNLDLLIMVNAVLMFPILLALYLTLRRAGETAMLLALTLGVVANTLAFVWNSSFTMIALSSQHAGATAAAERATLLAAGQAVLTTHLSGTAFDVYYVLGAVVFLLIGVTMLRSAIFGRFAAMLAIASGALTLVPPTVEPIGLYLSLIVLVPMSLWFVSIARTLFQLGREGTPTATTT
jgi:hypothetical protein